jgi:methylthioribose-1-phosphate isomerase
MSVIVPSSHSSGEVLQSLRYNSAQAQVEVIDQTLLPHQLVWHPLRSLDQFCEAIVTMRVRGAPLIGITAAYGLALALREDSSSTRRAAIIQQLLATRPTAVNLRWAMQRMEKILTSLDEKAAVEAALAEAQKMANEDVAVCRAIGDHGLQLLTPLALSKNSGPLQVMTHCNAGWLAALRWGTALSPIYRAIEAGIDLHVWVSETRPRNQGASLTAWELSQAGVPHTIIADNAAGHLMQSGKVDACIVGSDRTLANGHVCNKVGTYLKALAAHANQVPFYAAVPISSIDWENTIAADVPIEDRGAAEVLEINGFDEEGSLRRLSTAPSGSSAANPAFDVTPAELVTAIITERGVFHPAELESVRPTNS